MLGALAGCAAEAPSMGAPAPSPTAGAGGSGPSGTGGTVGGAGGASSSDGSVAPGTGGTGGSGPPPGGAPDGGGGAPAVDGDPPAPPPVPEDESGHLAKVVPVLWITVGGKAIPRDVKVSGRMKVIADHDGSHQGLATQAGTLDVPIGIETRGQSSFNYDQKPFGIEVRDDTGEGVAVPLLGLPPEADFVLHSCFADKSCMRNALTYAVGRELAVPAGRWAPRTRYVEVFIDGQYRGLYLLVERIKRDRSRVNIPGPGVAGTPTVSGYLFSQEGDGGRPGADFPSPFEPRAKLVYRYPKADVITPAQKTHLQDSVRALAMTMARERPHGEATRKLLDVASVVDYVLVQELANNVDGYWKSWFFTKEPEASGGRFALGPLWDFDIGYGNIMFKKRYCTNNWASSDLGGPFGALFKDPEFVQAMRCRWNGLRATGGPLDLARIDAKLAAFEKHMGQAKARDLARWRNIDLWVWPNNFIAGSWADEVKYLRYWLRRRLAWIDQNLPGQCAATPAPGPVELLPPPPKGMERNAREPYLGRDAPAYIPIEGNLPANLASWACPR
jgi:hypothetical protein